MKKNKLLTSVVALGTAAALTLGGTFAWQSINQTALNEASDVINPGGRLHDDFDGSNKDVYVENFTDPENGGQDIFARIRLEEYFEIIMNYGKAGAEKSVILLGSKEENTDEATKDAQPYTYTYETYKFDGNKNEDGTFKAAVKDGTSWWNWSVGSENSGEKFYMPTFNLNKDSLVADTNGDYVDAVGGISNRDGTQYENYVEYAAGDEKTDTEIYDGDSNDVDEVGTDFENLANYAANIVTVENKTHEAKLLEDTTALISMEEYLELGQDTGNYWVYDTDGWVYWANPIKPGETTGRLLDGIALSGVMDDTWYYAINVVAQFVTANDVGKEDGTGFYDTENGTVPSENAETLLRNIGVEIAEDTDEPGDEDTTGQTYDLQLSTTNGSAFVAITENDNVRLLNTEGAPLADGAFTVNACSAFSGSLAMTKDTDYTYENGVLTITNPTYQAAGVAVRIDVGEWSYDRPCGYIVTNPDKTLSLNQGISSSTLRDFAIVKVNETIPYVENGEYASDNEEPSVFDVTREQTTLSKGSDYTLENGRVTIINNALVGHLIELQRSGYQGRYVCIGYLLVEPASATGESEDEDAAAGVDWSARGGLRIITSNEYDKLCEATNEENDRMHWENMWSWMNDLDSDNFSKCVLRGYSSARDSSSKLTPYRSGICGFRPAFEAQDTYNDCTDLSVGDVVVIGTLYVGDDAVKVPNNPVSDGDITAYDEAGSGITTKITLRAALEDTDYQVKAVYVGNGVFVCDRVMLNYISWSQIDAALKAD